jgi:hypothetical protein
MLAALSRRLIDVIERIEAAGPESNFEDDVIAQLNERRVARRAANGVRVPDTDWLRRRV